MKKLELAQLCIAFFAVAMAFLFTITTMGAVSVQRNIMLVLLFITIGIVTVDEFVLTWRWKKKYATPKPDFLLRTKLSNYNACACFLFLVGVVLLVANLASGAAHYGLDEVGPNHAKGTLLDGFTILAVILYCALRTYLTWMIIPELSYKRLFRVRGTMTATVVGLAVCFLVGVILKRAHTPSGMDFPEFVTLLPGFFIPLIACMFRISTNQELNDRRIMPAMFIQPWPQTDPPTADVSTTCAEGVTPTWAEGTTPTWAEGTIPTWAEGTNPTWATKPTWAGETTHTWVHPPPQ